MISIFSEKGVCYFLSVIIVTLALSLTVSEMATYSLKLFIENCDQTAADGAR